MDGNIADLIQESTVTTGTVLNVALTAVTGYARFSDRFVATDIVYYTIRDGNNAEIGLGTVQVGNTLDRTTPLVTLDAGIYDYTSPTRISLTGAAIVAISPTAVSLLDSTKESMVVAIGDESTALTTGTAKLTFRMPYAFIVSEVRASLTTVSSSGLPTFDINEGGVSLLSTLLTIDVGEKTSTTATTPAVISDTLLADDAEITIDIDIAGTGAAGAKIYFIGTQV